MPTPIDIFVEGVRPETDALGEYVADILQKHVEAVKSSIFPSILSAESAYCNYDNSANRCAYILRYCASHAELVRMCMENFMFESRIEFIEWLLPVKKDGIMKMCCFGGGPGPEVIGVLDSLNVSSGYFDDMALDITNFDYHTGWKETYERIMDIALNSYFEWSGAYERCFVYVDLLQALPDDVVKKIEEADLVTMVKFVSSVMWDTENCIDLLKVIFHNMKVGAIVLYVDNRAGGCFELFQEIAQECLLRQVYLKSRLHLRNVFKRNSKDVPYFCEKKFGVWPANSTNASAGIWVKTSATANYLEAVALMTQLNLNSTV